MFFEASCCTMETLAILGLTLRVSHIHFPLGERQGGGVKVAPTPLVFLPMFGPVVFCCLVRLGIAMVTCFFECCFNL
jgi:hypothetical protein